ncbi:hypothetical protein [Streptomyces erythrochromogenes]|uniref:hypothetical protein n=1 Tax=Streptomyces erythrochromogenes TaxID=285574 RepID=UPI00367B880F
MYEQEEPAVTAEEYSERADRVVRWLNARREVERRLREPLDGLPRERDETLSRMAEALQGAAQGLSTEGIAAWAGVSEEMLQGWLTRDSAFAAAMASARKLAEVHAGPPGEQITAAMIRVVVTAMGGGATWPEAARIAGIPYRRFRLLWRNNPALEALADAALRARGGRIPASAPRRQRRLAKAAAPKSYRLVRRDDALHAPLEGQTDQERPDRTDTA